MKLKTSITIISGCLFLFIFLMLPVFLNIKEKKDDMVASFKGSEFSLKDVNNKTITEKSFDGPLTAIFFGFTNCPDICPMTLYNLDLVMNELETKKKESKTENFVTNFNYIIKFADFYFEDSAIMLKNRLFEEHKIENILIKKLSQNNFRVYKGPYKDFEKLKKGFHNIENLDFDSIEIIKL